MPKLIFKNRIIAIYRDLSRLFPRCLSRRFSRFFPDFFFPIPGAPPPPSCRDTAPEYRDLAEVVAGRQEPPARGRALRQHRHVQQLPGAPDAAGHRAGARHAARDVTPAPRDVRAAPRDVTAAPGAAPGPGKPGMAASGAQ